MSLEVIDYGAFSKDLHDSIYRKTRLPTNATIEITRRCPLTCAHCYNNLPMGDVEARKSETTYEEYCRMLDEMADAGTLWLLFTGGEIFARKDFLDIYTYAKRKGFIITLFTNAILITPEIADYLAEWRPFSIEITLYGATKETYEQLTGVAGSYDRCLNGIRLLKERGLPLTLKTIAVTINKHEIWDMKKLADDMGLHFRYDLTLTPRIDCSKSPLAVRLTPEEIVEIELLDPERLAKWDEFSEKFGGVITPGKHSKGIYTCGGGQNDYAVHADGNLSICVSSYQDGYNLKTGSFAEGWDDFLLEVRNKPVTVQSKCMECGIRNVCGMCPAKGEMENEHAEKPVDYLCHLAHLRAQTFNIHIPEHGDCEYCRAGAPHDEVLAAATRLRRRRAAGTYVVPKTKFLPVLKAANAADSVGGCGGCGLA